MMTIALKNFMIILINKNQFFIHRSTFWGKKTKANFVLFSQENDEKYEIGAAVERKRPMTKEDIHKMNLKKKTRKRTRKFEIDGVTVTTTTSKVIYRWQALNGF